ncbi:MAG: aminotransferase class V-fold PLP-dependent enzyme [Deltaproteobacteria bacterium]|nr:aminotransferase class V-fold PLP-dependent enzyme [Deltaproteobacteria bacterium]
MPIYLDNAATSWPKAPGVSEAMTRFINEVGANPGRSGHRMANQAARLVDDVREQVAGLFGFDDPLRVVFAHNVTHALNIALFGLLRPGDHVVTSSIEHNSMMRPLTVLAERGVAFNCVDCRPDGSLDPQNVEAAIRPETKLIALTHASNVLGTLLPIAEVGEIARRRNLLLLVDAAATAGCVPLDMERDRIDLLGFTGHKCMLGPTGTGGLVIGSRVDMSRVQPLMYGGTGSRSVSEAQPPFLPDLLESGTLNVAGLAGLGAALAWVGERGVEEIRAHHELLIAQLLEQLGTVAGVTIHGPATPQQQTAIVSFSIDALSPSEAGLALDEEYGVLCRVGLHCAPRAHQTAGTFPGGTIRFAPGVFTSTKDIEKAAEAVCCLAERASHV